MRNHQTVDPVVAGSSPVALVNKKVAIARKQGTCGLPAFRLVKSTFGRQAAFHKISQERPRADPPSSPGPETNEARPLRGRASN
jgi:hypothetical protein